MKIGRWHDGSELPKKTGWYLRDYRNPPKTTCCTLDPFAMDYFVRAVEGGFWYVISDYNGKPVLGDALFESLPWCKIKE